MAATVVRPAQRVTRINRPGLVVVGLLAVLIAGYSLWLYSTATLDELAGDRSGLGQTYAGTPGVVRIAFYLHIGAGSLALLLGPGQFSSRLRAARPALHRLLGRFYLGSVLIAALTSLVIVPWSDAGFVALFGFGSLAVLWLWTGIRALRSIRNGDVPGHQAWMIRNYALTFAAPTLRLWLGVLILVQVPFLGPGRDFDDVFTNAYAVVPLLCWLPNLLVAEGIIRRRGLPSYRIVR